MKNQIVKTVLVIVLIIALTIADFILLGMNLIAYAADSYSDIKFDAYFKAENEKVYEAEYEINSNEMKLYIEVSVVNGVSFDGVITLTNSNFKLKQELNEGISQIKENVIVLDTIRGGNKAVIEVGIEPITEEDYDEGLLRKESMLTLTGNHINDQGENNEIEISEHITLTLTVPENIEEITSLEAKTLTNSIYKVGEANKRIVQIELNSAIAGHVYPVKSTTFEVTLPNGAEVEEVISKGTYITGGEAERKIQEFNLENNVLTITILNLSSDGKISWNKNGKDNVIVTLKLSENQEIEEESYNVKSKVMFYGEEQKEVEKGTTYDLSKTLDGIITTSIENEEEIYKGKIYSKEDRQYNSITNIEVNYANLIEESSLHEKTIYKTDTEDKVANIQYHTTIISKAEFDKVLGLTGTLVVKDQNGNGIKEIKSTDFGTEKSITISYPDGVKELTVEISKAIGTGIIRLNHIKEIKQENYEIKEIRELKYLVEQSTVHYGEIINNYEKTNILGETTSEVGLTLSNTTLSEQNQDITITLTLKNDNEKYELYSYPEFKFTFPEGITINSVGNATVSATADELIVSNLVTKDNQMILRIDGEQKQYVTSDINPQISFTANVSMEKLMPNKAETIKVEYVNKYVNAEKIYQITSNPINIISSNSKVVTNLKLENYDGTGNTIQKYSDSQTQVSGKIAMDSDAREVVVRYTAINNYDSAIFVTPIIIANYIDKNEKQTKLLNYAERNIALESGQMKEIELTLKIPQGLYFSEKVQVQTLLEYSYLGIGHEVRNNIELKTEGKEGFREETVLNNKIKVEAFSQLGDGTGVRADDEIYNEQVIQYIINVTNISNEAISNIEIINKQDNGKIYDLKTVIVKDKPGQTFEQHIYAELDTDIKTFEKIETLNPGEERQLICKVVAKKTEESQITSANISVSADEIEKQSLDKISNTVIESDLKVSIRNAEKYEVQKYGNDILYLLTNVKNLTNENMENVKVRKYFTEGLTYNNYYSIEAIDMEEKPLDILGEVTYNEEERYVEFNILKLEANQEVIISSSLHIKSIPLEQMSANEEVYIVANNVVSNSADISIKQNETKVSVLQTTNTEENQKVKDGELVIITGEISNTGYVDTQVTIEDTLPTGLEVNKVELIKGNEIIDKTEDVGEKYVSVSSEIDQGQTIWIRIEAKVNTSRIVTKEVKNKITVVPSFGEHATSNEIIIQIDSRINSDTEDEVPDEDEPVEEDKDPEIDKPDDDNHDDEKEPTYTISGHAWVDMNANGNKDENEEIKNVIVKIIDLNNKNTFVKDQNGNEIEVRTGENGEYKIAGIPKGNYNVIFKYDISVYELKANTDIKDYIIEATQEKVAITNNILLESDKSINITLMEITEFDLKIDKYISKVIVNTINGTKTTEYTNKQLVREEIQGKYMSGATVLVEYTIQISNTGELAGYATEIIDYLPKDMKFHSELNAQWYIGEDENIYNTSLSNKLIKPGEMKTVKLVLLKTMTKESTGTTLNIAEISDSINSKEYVDIDSSNNQSKAEIIVNTATGTVITYLIAIMNGIAILAIGMYIIKKKVVGKEQK